MPRPLTDQPQLILALSLHLLLLAFFIALTHLANGGERKRAEAVAGSLNSVFASAGTPFNKPVVFTASLGDVLADPAPMERIGNLVRTALGFAAVRALFRAHWKKGRKVRLLGVRAAALHGAAGQLGLVDDEEVADLHRAGLHRLDLVAHRRRRHVDDGVGDRGDVHLVLAGADGLDQDSIEACGVDDGGRRRVHDPRCRSYDPGTTGGEKQQTSSSGSGPSDTVACWVPGDTHTVTPGSISAVASGVTIRPRPAAQHLPPGQLRGGRHLLLVHQRHHPSHEPALVAGRQRVPQQRPQLPIGAGIKR